MMLVQVPMSIKTLTGIVKGQDDDPVFEEELVDTQEVAKGAEDRSEGIVGAVLGYACDLDERKG